MVLPSMLTLTARKRLLAKATDFGTNVGCTGYRCLTFKLRRWPVYFPAMAIPSD